MISSGGTSAWVQLVSYGNYFKCQFQNVTDSDLKTLNDNPLNVLSEID